MLEERAASSRARSRVEHRLIGALDRLLRLAEGDTGQSRIAADFLLAWWNASACGGFDFADLWGLDRTVRDDVVAVIELLAEHSSYPDALGYKQEFEQLVRRWRRPQEE